LQPPLAPCYRPLRRQAKRLPNRAFSPAAHAHQHIRRCGAQIPDPPTLPRMPTHYTTVTASPRRPAPTRPSPEPSHVNLSATPAHSHPTTQSHSTHRPAPAYPDLRADPNKPNPLLQPALLPGTPSHSQHKNLPVAAIYRPTKQHTNDTIPLTNPYQSPSGAGRPPTAPTPLTATQIDPLATSPVPPSAPRWTSRARPRLALYDVAPPTLGITRSHPLDQAADAGLLSRHPTSASGLSTPERIQSQSYTSRPVRLPAPLHSDPLNPNRPRLWPPGPPSPRPDPAIHTACTPSPPPPPFTTPPPQRPAIP